jgi:uncharacterized OB-fold protein
MAMVCDREIAHFDADVKFILTSTSVSLVSAAGSSASGLPLVFQEPHMSEERAEIGPLPVVPFMKVPDDGEPYFEGCACKRCNAVFLGQRSACSKCGAGDQLDTKRLSNRGTLYTYSIVHRSFPGVAVPFVSAVVDLEGGGSIKGNLIGVEPDPDKIAFGMPVDVIYKDALGRRDSDGNSYLGYFFQPRRDSPGNSR